MAKGKTSSPSASSLSPQPSHPDKDRVARIVTASFEVFSECSFQDATTGEIARRAHVSKRDIYANFPDKHSLLLAAMIKVLKEEEAKIAATIAVAESIKSVPGKLESLGLVLIEEVLSAPMSVITRHVTSESIGRPLIGTVYFENGPARRSKQISKLLSSQMASAKKPPVDVIEAGDHYLALLTHQPLLSTLIGMQDVWDAPSVKKHVTNAVASFLRAYPSFASQ
jgi:AcrR family transcriptional regulator